MQMCQANLIERGIDIGTKKGQVQVSFLGHMPLLEFVTHVPVT
jgi:hypothetical protein